MHPKETEHSEIYAGTHWIDDVDPRLYSLEALKSLEPDPQADTFAEDSPGPVRKIIAEDLPEISTVQELTPEQIEALAAALTPAIQMIAEVVKDLFDHIAAIIKHMADAAGLSYKLMAEVVDAMLCAAADNPKHWHLYKHAKKARTRKKYKRLLMRQLCEKIQSGAAEQ